MRILPKKPNRIVADRPTGTEPPARNAADSELVAARTAVVVAAAEGTALWRGVPGRGTPTLEQGPQYSQEISNSGGSLSDFGQEIDRETKATKGENDWDPDFRKIKEYTKIFEDFMKIETAFSYAERQYTASYKQ